MQIANILIRYRWWVVSVLSVLALCGAAAAPFLRFDFTPQAVFLGNDDLVVFDEQFKRTFGYQDAVVLVVLEATGPEDVLAPPALEYQRQSSRRLAGVAGVQRIEAVAQLRLAQRLPGLGLAVGSRPLLGEGQVGPEQSRRVREGLAQLPLVDGELISRDRRLVKTVLFADPACREAAQMRDLLSRVREAAATPPPGYALRFSGLPVLRMDIVAGLRKDLFTLLPLAGGLFLVILLAEFRRLWAAVLPLAAVGAGLAWTVGLLVWAGQEFNIVSNVLPVMLLVIGMANCVHLVSRYGEEAALAPVNPVLAARRTIHYMLLACLLTSVTTMVGFGSLMAAHSSVLRALGLHAVIGVGLLYVSTVALLGGLLPSLRPPAARSAHESALHPVGRLVGWAGATVARRPRRTLLIGAAAVAASLLVARNARVDSYMMETYDPSHPSIQTLRLVERQLSGILPLEISLASGDPQVMIRADAFARAARARSEAAAMPGVVSARSYTDVLGEVYVNITGQEKTRAELGVEGEVGRRRLELAAQAARRAGQMVHPEMFLTPDGRQGRILLRVSDIGTGRMLELISRLEARLAEIFPPACGIQARLTGDAYVHARAMDRFVRDLFWSLLSATVIIFGVIALLFWSLRLGLIAVLPNLAPLLLVLAYIVLRGYELNAGNVVVFAVSIGIAVDNTIHFMARFREEVALDGDVAAAIGRSFQSAGRAVVLATFLIVAGLSVLLMSQFVPSRRFAELTGVTLLSALMGNLLLLPACLMLFWKAPRGRTPAPASPRSQEPATARAG